MSRNPIKKSDRIIIVGAGAFGLSTALHLALRDYNNITVLDRHDYDVSGYDYRSGADSASSGTYFSKHFVGATVLLPETKVTDITRTYRSEQNHTLRVRLAS
jgi:glycine/D-amino acid oxidase-like deaminating enzyme